MDRIEPQKCGDNLQSLATSRDRRSLCKTTDNQKAVFRESLLASTGYNRANPTSVTVVTDIQTFSLTQHTENFFLSLVLCNLTQLSQSSRYVLL